MIPEYQMMIAGLLLGLAVGVAMGCPLGWILRQWKQEGDEQIRQALERRLELLRDIQRSTTGGKTRAYSVGAGGFHGYREAEAKPESGTNQDQPVRPYLDPSRIGVSDQILVDRDELVVLCDRAAGVPYGDLHALKRRARQMLEKIGQDIREENRP